MAARRTKVKTLVTKIVVVGNSGIPSVIRRVGKTCIVKRYCEGNFSSDTKSTVGVDFHVKTVEVDNRPVSLEIWDTAGQERYRAMSVMFYRGAQAGVIVFDLTNRTSFNNLNYWLETMKDVADNSNLRIPFVVVGNKVDVEDGREIKREEAEEWCKRNGDLLYFETSAVSNTNLDEVFFSVAQEVVQLESQASLHLDMNGDRTVEIVDGGKEQSPQSKCFQC